MELLILILSAFIIIHDVSAYPAKGHPYKSEHCIKMTPKKEQEINNIITRITDFLNNITTEFEDFDIRLVKLDIESHSEDEVEEKDLKLQLTVNDCAEDTEYDEEEAQMAKENNDSNDEQEKDVIAEVSEESTKQKPNVETTSQPTTTTTEQTNIVSTTQGNSNGCEKCPCVCDYSNQNKSPSIKEEKHDNNVNTNIYEANATKIEERDNNDQDNIDSDKNEPNATRNEADTSKNIVNDGKNKTETNKNDVIQCIDKGNHYDVNDDKNEPVPNKSEENQTNTIKENDNDVTPIEIIKFYDFGEDTSSNNNSKDDEIPEITEIYTFSNQVEGEIII